MSIALNNRWFRTSGRIAKWFFNIGWCQTISTCGHCHFVSCNKSGKNLIKLETLEVFSFYYFLYLLHMIQNTKTLAQFPIDIEAVNMSMNRHHTHRMNQFSLSNQSWDHSQLSRWQNWKMEKRRNWNINQRIFSIAKSRTCQKRSSFNLFFLLSTKKI